MFVLAWILHLLSAPAFACGAETCHAGEYCVARSGGVHDAHGNLSHAESCAPLPDACRSTPTCGCLKAAGVAMSTCSDARAHVIIGLLAP